MTVTFAGTVEQFMPFKPMYEHGLRELLSCYEPLCKVAINVTPADPDPMPDPARPRAAEVAGVAERGERGGRHLQDDRRARGHTLRESELTLTLTLPNPNPNPNPNPP